MKSRRAPVATDSFAEFRCKDINQTIAARFEQQARKHPGRLALRHNQSDLTYRELNGAANRIALTILGSAGASAPVAVFCSAAPATIIASLGALKAGKAFALLDGRAPISRTKEILASLRSSIVLSDRECADVARRLAGKAARVIEVDGANAGALPDDLRLPISPDSLAYVNFTSGSSGAPKGVMWNHRSELFGIRTKTNALRIVPSDRVSLLRAHSVGAARDMFLALLNGAALIAGDLDDGSLASLAKWLRAEKITVFSCVATIFRHVTKDEKKGFPSVRLIHIGGEPIFKSDFELYRRCFPEDCRFVARYSISETQAVSYYFLNKRTEIAGDRVPVGYLLDGNSVTILDEDGRPVKPGTTGEIAVRSAYLAAGYWGDPKLTRAKFRSSGGGERTYLTGDLGYFLDDGCLVHVGRKDFQTKIRGHRIELTAVERALHDIAAIRQAAVVNRTDGSGKARLIAYVAPHKSRRASPNFWRKHLRARLPGYMVPSEFVVLDRLPVNAGGKIDRRALSGARCVKQTVSKPMFRPRNALEKALARFWADALEVQAPGVRDDFVELGGNSLQAAQVIARIHELFSLRSPLRSLPPTIEAAAKIILAGEIKPGQAEKIATAFLRVEGSSEAEVEAALRRPAPRASDG
jgi:amino acid adenylation domain-containing protein